MSSERGTMDRGRGIMVNGDIGAFADLLTEAAAVRKELLPRCSLTAAQPLPLRQSKKPSVTEGSFKCAALRSRTSGQP